MMEEIFIEERRTPAGFRVKVDVNTYEYYIYNSKGNLEVPKMPDWKPGIPVQVPRVVFVGGEFNLTHFILGELSFVNSKDGKMSIPYQYGSSKEAKVLYLPAYSECDIMPVILYHYESYKDVLKATERGIVFKHIVVDESFPKNEMVSMKLRYPKVNILIQKKKVSIQS
jgi:hypothetical protein